MSASRRNVECQLGDEVQTREIALRAFEVSLLWRLQGHARILVMDSCFAVHAEASMKHGGIEYHELRYPIDVAHLLYRYLAIPEDSRVDRLAILGTLQSFFDHARLINMDRYSKWEEILIGLISQGRSTEVRELEGLLRRAQARGTATSRSPEA